MRIINICQLLLLVLPFVAKSQGINIMPGGNLTASGTATIEIVDGGLINNGTYTKGSETVTFSGNTSGIIAGTSNTDMYFLTIVNSGGITTRLDLFTVNNLSITSGSRFTIDPVKAVTVSGSITNSAGTDGLVVKSEVTGTASLIHNSDNVPATMECYMGGAAEAWHFIASPVSDQVISGNWLPSGTYGNGTGYDLYIWNEETNCWIYNLDNTSPVNWSTVHPGAGFESARGYLYAVQVSNPTKEFAGKLNNGPLSISLTASGPDASLKGFNLAGNPYPSAVDWAAAAGWNRDALKSSGGGYDMWIWNPAANNYGVYNSADADGIGTNSVTGTIAPMQGYFVQAAAAGYLEMNNVVRVPDGTGAMLKSTPQEISGISIVVSSDAGYGSDEIQLGFGYAENENGAMKLFSRSSSAPSLYLASGGVFLSVFNLTNTGENSTVPVKFTPGMNGSYTLTGKFNPNNFETILLEDRKMHITRNLKSDTAYTFSASLTDDANRFVLYFGPVNNQVTEVIPAKIYTHGMGLVVDLTLISRETEVIVYDIMGRLVLQQKLQGKIRHSINLNDHTQILIVRLNNPDGSLCQKLLWGR